MAPADGPLSDSVPSEGESNPPKAEPLVVHESAFDPEIKPDLARMQTTVLKDGPRARKIAKYTVLRNRHTGEVHHDALVIETNRNLKGVWSRDDKSTIWLSNEEDDEIQRLLDFLNVIRGGSIPKKPSSYVVLPATGKEQALQDFFTEASDAGKIDLLADVLRRAMDDATVFQVLLERAQKDPELFREAMLALNLAAYRQAVAKLQQMIDSGEEREEKYQKHLEQHPWMFGSEYSELLDRRKWTRDENQDFVVRRTTDGYIEVIEIKTPLGGKPLYIYDRSHDSYYQCADLSKVIGQVEKYLEEFDANRSEILRRDGEDSNKIRVKIIIGRDGDDNQRTALRRHNGHLHRMEVLTFDQILKVAKNVLGYLEAALNERQTEEEVPF